MLPAQDFDGYERLKFPGTTSYNLQTRNLRNIDPEINKKTTQHTSPSRFMTSIFLISIIAAKNHKKPHHPSKVQAMNCLTAKACGRWLPLLSITLQGCTSFRHLTFHSVHCHPPASATLARMLPSFHCTQANPQFHSAPLWLFQPTFRNSKPKREAAFHQIPFAPLHSVTTLALPNPISGMSCEVFAPEDQKPQKPHRPLMVQIKIEGHSRTSLCLQPVRFTHSTVPFVPHYTISFVHLTSFSTPRVSVSFLTTHTFPHPHNSIPVYFTCELFAP